MTDQEYLIALGKKVRARRKHLGISMKQVSDYLGLDPKTINRIELARKECHITTLRRIADALWTDVASLLP